jgi:hypothetical protein
MKRTSSRLVVNSGKLLCEEEQHLIGPPLHVDNSGKPLCERVVKTAVFLNLTLYYQNYFLLLRLWVVTTYLSVPATLVGRASKRMFDRQTPQRDRPTARLFDGEQEDQYAKLERRK